MPIQSDAFDLQEYCRNSYTSMSHRTHPNFEISWKAPDLFTITSQDTRIINIRDEEKQTRIETRESMQEH